MNGLGNDFIIIDSRPMPDLVLPPAQIRALAARDHHMTKGCDQMLIIHPPLNPATSDIFMAIYNHNGSEVAACGNGTRAMGAYLQRHTPQDYYRIATKATPEGAITTYSDKENPAYVHSHMPPPDFAWDDIPLAQNIDTAAVILDEALPPAFMVNVGNPHAVFFVTEPEAYAKQYGAKLETHALFPEYANINFAHLKDEQTIALHTWERGAGLTQACGTGAYATAIAALKTHQTTAQQIYIHPPSYSDTAPQNFICVDYKNPQSPKVSGLVQFEFEGEVSL